VRAFQIEGNLVHSACPRKSRTTPPLPPHHEKIMNWQAN
jgi:hypothetical protein